MIKVKNLSKYYGDLKAVKNVSFEVKPGEIMGLIGPDGAGKTSLIRMLTTLLLPDEGRVILDGKDVVKGFKEIRNIVGYMPGRFSLYQDLSVEENLNFFATIFGTTVKANYDLIKPIYVQIEPFKKRKAGALSGGMKQKLALCCALIHKPKILFLDEPTTGVDAVSRKEFWEMLKDLKSTGLCILVSTPYMDEADLCDKVALMQKGNIMEINEPEVIKAEFKRDIFALKTPKRYEYLTKLKKHPEIHSVFAFGQTLHFCPIKQNLSNKEIGQLLNLPAEEVSVSKIKAGIEDCFMELMLTNGDDHE